jgi:hypothetical protein
MVSRAAWSLEGHKARLLSITAFTADPSIACVAVSRRHVGAIALDRKQWRLVCRVDFVVDKIGTFVGERLGLIVRQALVRHIKTQPGVQELTQLDRFDDRRFGAHEIHGNGPAQFKTRKHRE